MQDNNVLVSIICTAYNHEKYIKSALDGFVMQKTSFPFEALIHDDASTDNTASIIKEYAEKYPEIIVPILQTENQFSKKISITSDILLPMVHGKYVAFCEGDDFWTNENKLQSQIDFLENNPDYIACVHNTTFHYCSGEKKDELMISKNYEHDVLFEDVIWGMKNAYQTSSLVIKKEFLYNLPDFYYTALQYGFGDFPRAVWNTIVGKVHFLPYNMSTYRYMSTSTSWSALNQTATAKIVKQREGIILMLEGVKKYVDNNRKKLLDMAILEQKFFKLDLLEQYTEMFNPCFDIIWQKQSKLYKIKILVKKNFPWLLNAVKKIKGQKQRR